MRILAISNVSRRLAGLPLCLALVTLGLCAAPPGADACDLVVTGTYTVDKDETYDCMSVSGTLIIDGATLTLTGYPDAQSTVTGTVVLTDQYSKLHFTTNPHTVSGSGSIVGTDDKAQINVSSGITLTSRVTVCGHLKITGGGSFTNEGLVKADNGNGKLTLAITGTLEDTNDSHVTRWQVNTAKAVLAFDTAASGLDGRFAVSAGTLDFNYAVASKGRLDLSGGTVQVDADVTLGDQADSEFLSFTGGTIDVAAGCTFTHD